MAQFIKSRRQKLVEQVATVRRRLSPDVLNRLETAVEEAQVRAVRKMEAESDTVPFDRENAVESVKLFLDQQDKDGSFRRKLSRALKDYDSKAPPGKRPH